MALHGFVDTITTDVQILVKDNSTDTTTSKSMTTGLLVQVQPVVTSGKVALFNTGISVKSNSSVQTSTSYLPAFIRKKIDSNNSDFNLELSVTGGESKVAVHAPTTSVFKSNFVWV